MSASKSPMTLEEALDHHQGQKLSPAESASALMVYGEAFSVASCGTLAPGARCAETACVNGFKIVMYCDETNGCTKAVKVRC